jgi:hypothetical protein
MDRRTMIKRVAVAGAVVAWSTPLISVLDSRPAAAATATGDPVRACPTNMKEGTFTFQWTGESCTANPGTVALGTGGKSKCVVGGDCGSGPVQLCNYPNPDKNVFFLTVNGQPVTGGPCIIVSPGDSFTLWTDSNSWTISVKPVTSAPGVTPVTVGAECQQIEWHTSCSDPFIQGPLYFTQPPNPSNTIIRSAKIGGMYFTDWVLGHP